MTFHVIIQDYTHLMYNLLFLNFLINLNLRFRNFLNISVVKGSSILTKEDILNFLSDKISKYIEFTDTFPLTSTGKIKRN